MGIKVVSLYEKSITKMNDLDLCLKVVSRSCQPLRDIRRWIFRKPWVRLRSKGPPIGNDIWGIKLISSTAGTAWLLVLNFYTISSTRCCRHVCHTDTLCLLIGVVIQQWKR